MKAKLEPVTGIPPSSQRLTLRLPNQQEESVVHADDEESVEIGRWPLVAYAEIKVGQACIILLALAAMLFAIWARQPTFLDKYIGYLI